MTVSDLHKDPEKLTMTITTDFEFQDGFADESGAPAADMPTTITRVRLALGQIDTLLAA